MSLLVACDKDGDSNPELSDGEVDAGLESEAGVDGEDEGEGEPEDEPEDEPENEEEEEEEEQSYCAELWSLDATYPGDCACADPGEPCVQGCFIPDDVITCADVCAGIGESCVEDACAGGTYLEGEPNYCPGPSEYGSIKQLGCEEPVPSYVPWYASDEGGAVGVKCCCTQS